MMLGFMSSLMSLAMVIGEVVCRCTSCYLYSESVKHSVSILDIGVDNLYVNLVNMTVAGDNLEGLFVDRQS